VISLCLGSSTVATPLREEAREISRALEPFSGYWRDQEDPGFALSVESAQILMADNGRIVAAATVLRRSQEGFLVCQDGYEGQLLLRKVGERVELFDAKEGKTRRLEKLKSKPASLSLSLALPPPKPLPEEMVLSIQREIRLRYESDQALQRPDPSGHKEPPTWLINSSSSLPEDREREGFQVMATDRLGANAEYMRKLVQEIGWVDARRFGYPTSANAFFLVQHSRDLPLMLTVLPRIKEDAVAGLVSGENYALLYDRTQLRLGRLQRFGSQVARNAAGEWFVLPLEEPQGVDARRKEWGLQLLRDYVGIFGAPEVKLSTECSALASAHLAAPALRTQL